MAPLSMLSILPQQRKEIWCLDICSLVEKGLTSLTDKPSSIANSISQGRWPFFKKTEEEKEKRINIDSWHIFIYITAWLSVWAQINRQLLTLLN